MPALAAHSLLTELYTSSEVATVMLKIRPAAQREDVKQEAFSALFEKAEKAPSEILDLHRRGKLKAYVVKTLYNMSCRTKSKHNTQRRVREIPTEHFRDLPEDDSWKRDEELLKAVSERMDAIYWYYRDMIRLYVIHKTYRKVAEVTGIPMQSVWDAVRKGREEILKEIEL